MLDLYPKVKLDVKKLIKKIISEEDVNLLIVHDCLKYINMIFEKRNINSCDQYDMISFFNDIKILKIILRNKEINIKDSDFDQVFYLGKNFERIEKVYQKLEQLKRKYNNNDYDLLCDIYPELDDEVLILMKGNRELLDENYFLYLLEEYQVDS